MKNTFRFPVLLITLLTACSSGPGQVSPTDGGQEVEKECTFTPRSIPFQGVPIPVAVVVNRPGGGWLDLLWRDGSLVGSWQIENPTPISRLHVNGPATAGVEETGLVYLASDETGNPRLVLLQTGETRVVEEFLQPTMVTMLAELPGQPVIAFSTLSPSEQGNKLQSTLYLAGTLPEYQSRIILQTERDDSRYLQPVAIHVDKTGAPDGIWYTTNLWGIGGDMLTNERGGLFFIDIKEKTSLEVLSEGCEFSSLTSGQSWAAWSDKEGVHAADLHGGGEVFHAVLPGTQRSPAAVIVSPIESFVAWLEGSGWQYDEDFSHTIRIGTLNGTLMGEYPPSAFVEQAGMGDDILIQPISWTMPDNECLLVLARDQDSDQVALLQLDMISGAITRLVDSTPIGYGYP